MLVFSVRPSSKRTITVLGALLTIITIAFYLHKNVDTSLSRSIWQPSQFLFPACTPRNRTNPWHIKGPSSVDPNQEALQEYWHNLKALFDTHPPSPIAVERTGGPEELKANGVKFNADGYPSVDFLGKLFNITDEDAEKTRQAHKSVMHGLAEYPTEETFQGRGIVTLAGGKYAEFAATSLGVLRELGSQLPVEVWVRDESEERAGWCAELAAEGMTCRRLSDYMELTALENPYQWKVFTILLSSFEHILFLDADSIFLKAPDDIFDDKVYLENGAILWPDYWKHTGSPRLPYIIGDSPHQHDSSWLLQNRTVDSGQILWNKKQHWQALQIAAYYNYYGPHYYYSLINNGWAGWGDKDTFSTALITTKEPYYLVKQGTMTLFLNNTSTGVAMVQTDPRSTADLTSDQTSPAPFILHANTIKWSMRRLMGKSGSFYLDSEFYKRLNESTRIYDARRLQALGMDPEVSLWQAMEFTACKSKAWGDVDACEEIRAYVKTTFGISYTDRIRDGAYC